MEFLNKGAVDPAAPLLRRRFALPACFDSTRYGNPLSSPRSTRAEHPELQEALAFALRHVASLGPQCASPVRVCAEKLFEFNDRRELSLGRPVKQRAEERRHSESLVSTTTPISTSAGRRQLRTQSGGRSTSPIAEDDFANSAMQRSASPRAVAAAAADGDDSAEDMRRASLGSEDADADERARSYLAATASRGGRKQVVFAEPVRLDQNWVPVIVPKSDDHKAEITSVLRANILFAGTDDDQRRTIVDAMTLKTFGCGEVIIREGDMGDFYYILSDGACDISKHGRVVLQARKGMGFGELALLYDSPRAATVVATSESVRAWALDRVTFKQVMIGTTMRKVRVCMCVCVCARARARAGVPRAQARGNLAVTCPRAMHTRACM